MQISRHHANPNCWRVVAHLPTLKATYRYNTLGRSTLLFSSAMPEMQQRTSLLSSANPNSQSSNPQADPHEPSSIPPWVHVNEGTEEQDALLALPPDRIRPNTRHYKPPPSHYKPGRKWDHMRTAEPPLLSAPIADHQQRWRPFMQSGPNPQMREGRIVDAAWMEENMPDLNPDWHPDDEEEAGASGLSAQGLMYKGKWLISPERQERTVRLFWVSPGLVSCCDWLRLLRYMTRALPHDSPPRPRYYLFYFHFCR